MNIYLLSGLGADERLFQNLPSINGGRYIPINYIHPQNAVTLADYARLLAQHYHFEPPFILGGVSIGGMIAQELAQILHPEKLLLISTARSRSEMPALFRIGNKKLIKPFISRRFLYSLARVGDVFTKKSPKGRRLFIDMLRSTDSQFLEFGARAVMGWLPPMVTQPVLRIHGTHDRVFPLSRIDDQEVIQIKGGNHFMIYEMGEEVGKVVEELL